jgi:hypothetical protein
MGGAGLVVAFILSIWVVPVMGYNTQTRFAPDQPVPFSHKHHVSGLGLDCRYCHTTVETASNAGMPATTVCMTCHSQIWTNAAMLAPDRQSLARHVPLRWTRVYTLPDYVFFDHSIHVAKGVGCTTCHGPVDTMPLMRQVAPLTMGWCVDCHSNPAPNLRPEDAIFAGHWSPPPDQAQRGAELVQHYGIRTEHLTDCSVCHR